jgi:hypothetical protein
MLWCKALIVNTKVTLVKVGRADNLKVVVQCLDGQYKGSFIQGRAGR